MTTKEGSNMTEDLKHQEYSNYIRLSLLMSKVGMRTLRLLCRERYKAVMNTHLENGDKKALRLGEDFWKKHEEERTDTSDINKLDFALLSRILCTPMSEDKEDDTDLAKDLNMGPTPSQRERARKQKAEEKILRILVGVQTYLEYLPEHRLPNGDYKDWWETAATKLLRLGALQEDVEHFRTCTILAPHELSTTAADEGNERKSKALRGHAAGLIAAGKFEVGMLFYNKALLLEGLSAGEKACLYYNRSTALLDPLEDGSDLSGDDVAQRCLDTAMGDARLVIQLEPKGWKGYFLEGKVFQLRKLLNQAIDSFELALTLNPDAEEVQDARSECRFDQYDILSQIQSETTFTPCKLSEIFQSRAEIKRLVMENVQMTKSKNTATRLRGEVFMGHRYQLGDQVPLDLERATQTFLRAAKEGSVEGAYYAGLNYLRGIGVKRNIPMATRLFQDASQPLKEGLENRLHNVIAAKAKAVQGMLSQYGIMRPRSLPEAMRWYNWAQLEGCGTAAMKLAGIFSGTGGVIKNTKLAVEYQRLAVELGSGGARGMYFLGRLYLELGNLPLARYWCSRASTLDYTAPILEQLDFEELLQYKEQQFEELKKKLPAHVLSSNVPIHTLHDRYVKRLGPALSAPNTPTGEVLLLYKLKLSANAEFIESARAEPDIAEVKQLAEDGQEYARLLLEAHKHWDAGVEAIKELLASSDPHKVDPSHLKTLKAFALAELTAYYIAEVGPTAASLSTECRNKLMEVAEEFIQDEGERSVSDLHARVCRLNLLIGSSAEEVENSLLEFAKVCQALYPEEPHFHAKHSNALGLLGKFDKGLKIAEEGLKQFPSNWELLYARARHLLLHEPHPFDDIGSQRGSHSSRGTLGNDAEAEVEENTIQFRLSSQMKAYQEFLKSSPSGHPKIPEAHYQLANLNQLSENVSEYEAQYQAGVEAEKSLLGHFLPYESQSKKKAELGRKKVAAETCGVISKDVLEQLLETEEVGMGDSRGMKDNNVRRILIVNECRRRLLSGEVVGNETERMILGRQGFIRSRAAVEVGGQPNMQQSPTPEEIPSLMMSQSTSFEELDPTIDQVHKGRIINLTIMEEYIEGNTEDPILTVVKDDHNDFSFLLLFNFDPSDPSTTKKLSFGSRIRLMNPYVSLGLSSYGGPMIRVDDPNSILFISSGEGTPMCRFCCKPNPSSRCTKCNVAQYCDKDCQMRDWNALGHKDLCQVLCKSQKRKP